MEKANKLPTGLVRPDGTLNADEIVRREMIYKGMNGQAVERIYDLQGNSYIYKPLTNDEQWGLEQWVYANVLPSLPSIYPELLASDCDAQTGRHWLLFEDAGPLRHEFNEETAARLIRHMAAWHSLPADRWAGAPLRGQKPLMEAIEEELRGFRDETMRELAALPIPPDTLPAVFAELERKRAPLAETSVLSHGDLHLGNYALAYKAYRGLAEKPESGQTVVREFAGEPESGQTAVREFAGEPESGQTADRGRAGEPESGQTADRGHAGEPPGQTAARELAGEPGPGCPPARLIVLDWEHAHLNSPLWDLYHMIDMSHPRYRKRVTSPIRERLLRLYAKERQAAASAGGQGPIPAQDAEALLRHYALFACSFSIWMLRLIRRDLEGGTNKWPRLGLLAQMEETAESLVQCRELLR